MTKSLVAAAIAVVTLPLAVLLLAAATLGNAMPGSEVRLAALPSGLALRDMPADYLAWYMGAAHTCPGLPWQDLAGIGKVESDHGRSHRPGVYSGANRSGAEGPMQLLPGTFARYAVTADPHRRLTPYDPPDAIYTAARMLCAVGARGGSAAGIERAIYAYNHATWYVSDVLRWAARYTAPSVPAHAVAAAVAYAEAQLGKPYCWGGQGPGCFDCSGLVFASYAAAGINIARTTFQWWHDGPQIPLSQIQPGDLLFSAGSDGTPVNPGHVVMYLGHNQVIQAPQAGEDVQIDPLSLTGVVVATRPADLIPHGAIPALPLATGRTLR
jgi:cell wall-associated NlpC family hydrolase